MTEFGAIAEPACAVIVAQAGDQRSELRPVGGFP
jgi:hypothetical protein